MKLSVSAVVACLMAMTAVPVAGQPMMLGNVGVSEILRPSGTVDSGVPLIPSVVVRNYGPDDESLDVVLVLEDGFTDVVHLPLLGTQQVDTIEFSPWTPLHRDSLSGWAWTECDDDSFPADDTARVRFLIGVARVDLRLLGVGDTLDSGVVYRPRCVVRNRGNMPVPFEVRFNITGELHSVASGAVSPGDSQIVTAPDSWVTRPGLWNRFDSLVAFVSDTIVLVRAGAFRVLGSVLHDLELGEIVEPGARVDTLATVNPTFRVINNGPLPETCMTWFEVRNPAQQTVYLESLPVVVNLPSVAVVFPPTRFRDLGPHEALCSLYCARDQNQINNTRRQVFEVVAESRPDVSIIYAGTPGDTFDTIMPVAPLARLRNQGSGSDSGWVICNISDPNRDTLVYADSAQYQLMPGMELPFPFRPQRYLIPGRYQGTCWLLSYGGCQDTATFRFWIVTGMAVLEWNAPEPSSEFRATLFRGPSLVVRSHAILLDVRGRRILDLAAGQNDIRGLPAGVYFLAPAGGAGRRAVPKIIIQR